MKKLVEKKFIKLFFFLIISLLVFPIAGCQGGGIYGKYYQYDGEFKNEESWFELKSGNKWSDDEGMAGRYELNGDKITLYSEVFGEEEELMSGTVKDGVLIFSLMGMTQVYKKDGATGNGDGGEQVPFYSENKDYFSQESQSYIASNLSISNGMVKRLNVSNFSDELYLRVPYNTKSISLADYISSSKRWDLCEDKDGKNQVSNTVIEISPGQRKVCYIFLPEESKSIQLTIEQKSTFLVSYYDQYGEFIITHHYATDSYLSVPDFEYKANLGYSEYKWAYLALGSYQIIEEPSEFLARDGLKIRVSPIANEYNLTLDPDGGNVSQATKTIRYNDVYELPVPSKEGHTFTGWYQNEIQYTDEEGRGLSSWHNTENANLKAIYTINDYEVTLTKNNERSGEISINNGGTNSSFDFDSLVTVIAKTTTDSILKDEYSFLGWYNGEDLLSTEMEYTFNMPSHALNLQAKWTPKEYTITYNLNGGLNDPFNPESYNVDDEIELRNPSKGTNTFAGWYDNIDFEGQAIFSIPQNSKGNKVFYAKWFNDEQATFGLNYILVDDSYYVAAGNEAAKNIVIPEFYSGKPVVGIDDYGFMNTDIESISIPSSIVYIGENAFWNCKKLTSIIIPDSVQTIGKNTFGGCTVLTEITLPFIGASIDATESEAVFGYVFSSTFFEGSYVASQYYSYKYAIYYLSLSLTTVTITGGDLKPGSFYNCSSLVSITIPDTVSSIDENTFYNCTNLSNINVDKENENFTDNNGVLFNKSQTILIHYPAGKSGPYSIPAKVTEIKTYAFRNCANLTTINIPNSITQIGDSAFMGCSSLKSVRLPDDLSELLGSTFMGCTGLESVSFNSSLKSIGANAFSGCISLSELTIPDSVTSIGSSAFGGCRGLTEMTLPFIGSGRTASQTNSLFGYIFGTTYYEGSYSAKQFYYYNQAYPQSYNATYYIPSDLETITITGGIVNYGAFFNCINIKTVNLLEVTKVEDYAFAFCISIKEMVFPDSITTMGNYILSNCNSIETITVPYLHTTVTNLFGLNICSKIKTMTVTGGNLIPESAFSGCNNLTTVVISDSVTSIGRNAFRGCENLTEMTLPFVGSKIDASPDLALFGYIFGNTSFTGSIAVEQYYSVTGKVIYNLPAKLTKVTITGGEIKYGAFSNCSNLTAITLPEEVSSIGDKAFYNCTSLTSLNMPESVISIGRDVFTNCKLEYQVYDGNLKYLGNWLIDTVNTNITNVNFKYNTIGIYDNAFANCKNIISIVIPDTVQSIGSGVFSGCTGLEEITLPFVGESINSSIKYFGFIFGASGYGTNVNHVPSSLKKVTIEDGQIAGNAFYGCKNLTSVNISDKVSKIGEGAFVGCSGLTEMTLPFVGTGETTQASERLFGYIFGQTFYTGSITTDQFYSDYNKMTYYIPENLRDVVITGGSIDYGAFYNCTTLTSITFPEKLTNIGEKAFHNCNKLVFVTIPKSVHSIGDSAFANCYKLQNVNMAEDSELTKIGFSAFQNCTSLLSITIPDGITSLYGSTFSGCSNLVAVIISENSKLNYIGDNAFSYCTNLESISIPEGVTNISQNAFYNSNKIIYEIYDNNLKYLNNWLIGTVGKTLETATLKAETTGIYYSAFENCSNLISINIPQEVMIIYDKAFLGCSNLVTVSFAENSKLEYLGEYAFSACSNLVNINLEENSQLEKLEENLFSNSSSIVLLTIPSSVTSIGEYAFSGCTNLATILLPESLTSIGNNAFNNCLGLRSLIIPDSVETIGSGALSGCSNLTELRVPFVGASLDATNANALFGYIFGKYSYKNAINTEQYYSSDSSASYYIPLSLKKVEITGNKLNYGAFYNCSMIEEIVFDNIINIGEVAFYNCSGLRSITIPPTTTNIGKAAFDKCLNLTYVYSNNPTPPEMIEAFNDNNSGLKIYVPKEALQSYHVKYSWSNYKN
ncbi:MAG: leucine-rich repeat protein, partial [Clostridia bacterium]|nr:leucine-rich repeat protein [Clostridia bacterium]